MKEMLLGKLLVATIGTVKYQTAVSLELNFELQQNNATLPIPTSGLRLSLLRPALYVHAQV